MLEPRIVLCRQRQGSLQLLLLRAIEYHHLGQFCDIVVPVINHGRQRTLPTYIHSVGIHRLCSMSCFAARGEGAYADRGRHCYIFLQLVL